MQDVALDVGVSMNKQTAVKALLLVVASLYILLLMVPLSRQGMYLDGVIYAAVAKNMALGIGTIWQPHYSNTILTPFYEHPPLAIYFESLLFRLLGQGFLVERLYSGLMAVGQLVLVWQFWRKFVSKESWSLVYLLLLWILVPLNVSIYKDNMLEGTLVIFSTLAVLLQFVQTKSDLRLRSLLLLFAALSMLLGFLANGPTAFFPLSVPLLRWLTLRDSRLRAAMLETIFLFVSLCGLMAGLFWLSPAALASVQHYLDSQLLASTVGTRTVLLSGWWEHLYVLVLYVKVYWPVTLLAGVLVVFNGGWRGMFKNHYAWFFLLLSLTASLPVAISHRQSIHYIMQSVPFYLLFLGVVSNAAFGGLIMKPASLKVGGVLLVPAVILFVLSVIFFVSHVATPRKHVAMLHDVHQLIDVLPNDAIISGSNSIYYAWDAAASFARFSQISLASDQEHPYLLALATESAPDDYQKVTTVKLDYFSLWKKVGG